MRMTTTSSDPKTSVSCAPLPFFCARAPLFTVPEHSDSGALGRLAAESKGQPLQLFVYSASAATVREVDIVPSDTWGGDGLCVPVRSALLLRRVLTRVRVCAAWAAALATASCTACRC
jgi:hypothetical protein